MLSKGCGDAPERPPTFPKGRNPRRGIHYFGDVFGESGGESDELPGVRRVKAALREGQKRRTTQDEDGDANLQR